MIFLPRKKRSNSSHPLFFSPRRVWGTGLGLLLFVAGTWGLVFYWGKQSTPPGPKSLSPPGVFEALDLKRGKVLKLSSFAGQVVVVHFWATWCGPCFSEMITLNKLAGFFKGRLVVWAISDESPLQIKTFLKSLGHLSPYFLPATADKKETDRFFAVQAVPETFVFNPSGEFVAQYIGPRDWLSDPSIKKLQNLLP